MMMETGFSRIDTKELTLNLPKVFMFISVEIIFESGLIFVYFKQFTEKFLLIIFFATYSNLSAVYKLNKREIKTFVLHVT